MKLLMCFESSGLLWSGDSYSHLKRTRVLMDGGTLVVPSAKYETDIIDSIGLTDAKSARTPLQESSTTEEEDGEELHTVGRPYTGVASAAVST